MQCTQNPCSIILHLYYNVPIPNCTGKLTTDDLRSVRDLVWDARAKWRVLGIELRLPVDDLDSIKGNYYDIGRQFTEMLALWLQLDPPPTWSALVGALRSPVVGCEELAKRVEREITDLGPATEVQVGEFIG